MTRPRDVDEVKDALRVMLPELKARWPVSYTGGFGSWARREQEEGSDLELLVEFDRPVGYELVACSARGSRAACRHRWRGMAGLRDIIAHQYDRIDHGVPYQVVTAWRSASARRPPPRNVDAP